MFSYLRSVLWMCPLIGVATVLMGAVSWCVYFFDPTTRRQHKVAVAWAKMLLRICMVRVSVVGTEKLSPGQVYVFVSNHFSLIDTPLMFGSMPWEFRILARHNLWRIPFLGGHLKRSGHVAVERESPSAAARSLIQAAAKIQEGFSLLIFPEGGRTRQEAMRRFKSGAARIAIEAGCPIVPMAIIGTRKILPPSSAHLHPGRAELRIGEPIPTEGLTSRDAPELMQQLQRVVGELGGQ